MPGRKPNTKDLEFFSSQLQLMIGVLNGDIDRLELEALGDGQRADLQGDEGGVYAVEFSLELLEHNEKSKAEVLEALERIKRGGYGCCERCEAWIRKERLRAMPHTRHCIDCQRAVEEEHA